MGQLFAWLSSGAFEVISGQLARAYEVKLKAENDEARIAAEQQIARLEAQQAVLISEQSSKITRWIRPAFALPFVIYNFKIVVWDKVFGWGATDTLPPQYWHLQMIVFGAYFLTRPFEKRSWRHQNFGKSRDGNSD
ncbi:MAG: hypothetical protein JJ858_08090 [Rhizobiaceae bacterium]|nr:hypothetical protein [Rhizobiaceae bacterium]